MTVNNLEIRIENKVKQKHTAVINLCIRLALSGKSFEEIDQQLEEAKTNHYLNMDELTWMGKGSGFFLGNKNEEYIFLTITNQ